MYHSFCTVNYTFNVCVYFYISEAACKQFALFPDCLLESFLWQLQWFVLSSSMSWERLSRPNYYFLAKENSFNQRANPDQNSYKYYKANSDEI